MVIWVNIFENELMVEIYSQSLVRAMGKVLEKAKSFCTLRRSHMHRLKGNVGEVAECTYGTFDFRACLYMLGEQL